MRLTGIGSRLKSLRSIGRSTDSSADARPAEPSGFGTFAGVFTPSILTILGLILFLRLGFIVGTSGLGQALLVILAASSISVITSFSLAAIATNLRVKAGGDYYLISRTLGMGFGGAIGLVVFLAQSVSIGFYAIGFAEAMAPRMTWLGPEGVRLLATTAVVSLASVAWLGADWATRLQYVIMALILVALVSFAIGAAEHWDSRRLIDSWRTDGLTMPYWAAFALFFPAVTGFTQGVSMSGELRDPRRSIPLGTFLAVGISTIVYVGFAILFAASASLVTLANDAGAMRSMSVIGAFVDAGVVAATLSSALASLLGAPRVLQSMARDRLLPFLRPFAEETAANPRRGVLLSTAIALSVVGLGSLDEIARLVTMFFLVSYGLLNIATFSEIRSESPSFRPSFRWYDHRLSLAGGVACFGAMMAIDWESGLAAVAVLAAIYLYLAGHGGPSRWADGRRSAHLQQVREHLIAASGSLEHPRDWRPMLLVFSDDEIRRRRLLTFSSWIESRSGLTMVVKIVESHGAEMLEKRAKVADALAAETKELGSNAFPLVVAAPNLDEAIPTVLQSAGIGPLQANTVVVNAIQSRSLDLLGAGGARRFSQNLRVAFRMGRNLLVLSIDEAAWQRIFDTPAEERSIDIWWTPGATGDLMLILAHLMRRHELWRDTPIRVVTAAASMEEGAAAELKKMLDEVRIGAKVAVAPSRAVEDLASISSKASIVFIPFVIQGDRLRHPLGEDTDDILRRVPAAVLTLAAQDIDLDADPDEGPATAAAALQDRLADTTVLLEEAERAAAAIAESPASTHQGTVSDEKNEADDAELLARKENADRRVERLRQIRSLLESQARGAGRSSEPPHG